MIVGNIDKDELAIMADKGWVKGKRQRDSFAASSEYFNMIVGNIDKDYDVLLIWGR